MGRDPVSGMRIRQKLCRFVTLPSINITNNNLTQQLVYKKFPVERCINVLKLFCVIIFFLSPKKVSSANALLHPQFPNKAPNMLWYYPLFCQRIDKFLNNEDENWRKGHNQEKLSMILITNILPRTNAEQRKKNKTGKYFYYLVLLFAHLWQYFLQLLRRPVSALRWVSGLCQIHILYPKNKKYILDNMRHHVPYT